MEVKLVSCTQIEPDYAEGLGGDLKDSVEALMAFLARVSSAKQDNPEYAKLLAYCFHKDHWSVFEMADMTVEIVTSRAIAQQILRHRSFCFQEFSQRYAAVTECEFYEARRQDHKNRQNSIDDMPQEDKDWFLQVQDIVWDRAKVFYDEALERGIAKEQARFLLPLNTQTRMYMKGNVRSWLHYILLRSGNGTQKEHRDIAEAIKAIFIKKFPVISEALEWSKA